MLQERMEAIVRSSLWSYLEVSETLGGNSVAPWDPWKSFMAQRRLQCPPISTGDGPASDRGGPALSETSKLQSKGVRATDALGCQIPWGPSVTIPSWEVLPHV